MQALFTRHGWRVCRCPECTLLFVHPLPSGEAIRGIYAEGYFRRGGKYVRAGEGPERDPAYANYQENLDQVARHKPAGALLDVGCATGGFLKAAAERGYRVAGVEISDVAVRHARERLGLEVHQGDLASAGLASGSVDVITFWDVVEHLDDPLAVLAEAFRVLRPGGVLLMTTGDAGSRWAKLAGRFWHLMTPPQHLFFFNQTSLSRALEMSGFTVREFLHRGKVATVEFIALKLRETFGPLFAPVEFLAQITGLGRLRLAVNLYDIMTCVAEKPADRKA